MSHDRYVGLYSAGRDGAFEHDAEVLREHGIDFEERDGIDVETPEDKPPLPPGAAVMVFPDEENAQAAAEYIFVGDLEQPRGEMRMDGAAKLRA